MKRLLLPAAILIVLVTLTACCPCEKTRAPSSNTYPPTEIFLETGGGFSGYVSGTAITADGLVLTWHGRPGMRENLDTLARMDAARHDKLLADIYALDPASIRHQESGNMTTALTIVSGDEQWYWSWPGVRKDDEAVPESLRPIRDLVVDAITDIQSAQE
jgi:hypothetical protein